ncbi:MAG: hypothetical protein ACRDTM_03180 [Micromonosporaceae bacterium]
MEYAEFSALTNETVRGLLDRLPVKYHHGFEAALIGGELRMTVEALMKTLVADHVPVTLAERDNLGRMLAYLKEPPSGLDQLNVTTAS